MNKLVWAQRSARQSFSTDWEHVQVRSGTNVKPCVVLLCCGTGDLTACWTCRLCVLESQASYRYVTTLPGVRVNRRKILYAGALPCPRASLPVL